MGDYDDRARAALWARSATKPDDRGTDTCPDLLSRFTGCLLGGAVGDALGAPVEFMSLSAIRERFGPAGIQHYAPAYGRPSAITDDTQMTLFTADGVIRSLVSSPLDPAETVRCLRQAYLRWLATQRWPSPDADWTGLDGWLYQQRDLHARRAPGNTCLGALEGGGWGTPDRPINDSKGCGGVMRMAPVGMTMAAPFRTGCEAAAITHGHPSGYLAAGFLAQLIADIIDGRDLLAAIEAARGILLTWNGYEECAAAIDAAVALARSDEDAADAIAALGEGWVAEEALAISLFCALRAPDFITGVRLAVNHSGDSDSTGAITGNILGALWGKAAIPEEFLEPLELREVIEQVAEDLLAAREGRLSESLLERYPPG